MDSIAYTRIKKNNLSALSSIRSTTASEKGFAPIARALARRAVLLLAAAYMLFPFYWMISSALKAKEDIFKFPPDLIPATANWSIFYEALRDAPFLLYIFNSSITALAIVLFQIFNSALFSYVLTQFDFRAKKILFTIIMGSYMLPAAATYVPGYIILSKLGLINSYAGLIVSNCVSIFSVFLVRQAFLQVNKSILESAKIDGASHWWILWRVMVPLTKPTFISLALITFVSNYNNYMWPSLIIKKPELYLVTIGLKQFFIEGGAYGIKWPQVMAACTITVFPLVLLYMFFQKFLVRGISDSGVKG
jgi:multiple sugar transport system permease protein